MKKYILYLLLFNFLSVKAQKELDSLTVNEEWRANYLQVYYFKHGRAVVQNQERKYGCVDKNGNAVIPLKYEYLSSIKENGYMVATDSSHMEGILNLKGDTIVKFIYDNIDLEENGKFFIGSKGYGANSCAYLTINEKEVIPYKYAHISRFTDNLFAVNTERNGKEGILNKKGKVIFPIEYDRFTLSSISANLIKKIKNRPDSIETNLIFATKNGKEGIFDLEGKEILPCEYESISVWGNDCFLVKKNAKLGFLSLDAIEKTEFKYEKFQWYRDYCFGLINQKWGLINKLDRKTLISCSYDTLRYIHDSIFIAKKNNKFGLISINEQVLLPFEYDTIQQPTYEGLYEYYAKKDNQMILINKKFKEVTPFIGRVDAFCKIGNLNCFQRQGLLGIEDKEGNIILPYQYKFDLSNDCTKDSLKVVIDEKNNTKVILDLKNAKVLTKEYQDILIWEDVIILKENGKYAFADVKTLQPITPFEYQHIELFKRQLPNFIIRNDSIITIEDTAPSAWYVKKNNFCGIVDAHLNIKINLEYDKIIKKYENVYISEKHSIELYKGKSKKILTEKYDFLTEIDINQQYSIVLDSFLTMSNNNTTQNFGVIGINNRLIVPFTYDRIESTNIGFLVKKEDKTGFYNFNGKKIIELTKLNIDIQKNFIKTFIHEKDKVTYGLLDSQGDTIMPFKYKSIYILDSVIIAQKQDTNTIKNTVVSVSIKSSDEDYPPPPLTEDKSISIYSLNYGIFNFHKKQIAPFIYHSVQQEHKNFLVIHDKKGQTSIMDLKGNLIVSNIHTNIHQISENGAYIIVSKEGYYGLIDMHNNIIIPLSYDKISHIDKDSKYLIVQKKSKYGIIDIKENIIFPFQYQHIIPRPYSDYLYIFLKGQKSGTLNVISKEEDN